MKLLTILFSYTVILSTSLHSISYKEEFKNFKNSQKYKVAFDKDANSLLQYICRNVKNFKNLNPYQRNDYFTFLYLSSILITPKAMPKLYKFIDDLCKKEKIYTPKIFINTKKGMFNAFALKLNIPGGILIGQQLLNEVSDGELEAIITHEIGHIKHDHTIKNIMTHLFAQVGYEIFFLYLITKFKKTKHLDFKSASFLANLAGIIPAFITSRLIIGKKFEREADQFAYRHGKHRDLIKFFERLEEMHNKKEENFKATDQLLKENYYKLDFIDYFYLRAYPKIK